jgi:hypothetical protein
MVDSPVEWQDNQCDLQEREFRQGQWDQEAGIRQINNSTESATIK